MTREAIEARIRALAKQREELIANVNALNGAIEDCEYWLKEVLDTATGKPQDNQAAKDK